MPDNALQRTAAGVTACAPARGPAPAAFPHRLRRPPQSLSLGSLGHLHFLKYHTIILVAVAAALSGCSRGPVHVSVANRSGVTISNVCVSGTHFAVQLGTLTPGMEAQMIVHPNGDTRTWLSYEAGGQKIDAGGRDYFDVLWGHPVSVTIGADLKFTTPTGIKSH